MAYSKPVLSAAEAALETIQGQDKDVVYALDSQEMWATQAAYDLDE